MRSESENQANPTVITIATGVVDSLKAQPILLVIVLLNAIMIGGATYTLNRIMADTSKAFELVLNRCYPPPPSTYRGMGGGTGAP